jgi:hypothetical protein
MARISLFKRLSCFTLLALWMASVATAAPNQNPPSKVVKIAPAPATESLLWVTASPGGLDGHPAATCAAEFAGRIVVPMSCNTPDLCDALFEQCTQFCNSCEPVTDCRTCRCRCLCS